MKSFLFAAVLVGTALCMPFDLAVQKIKPKQRDNCGAITVDLKSRKLWKASPLHSGANSVNCQLCLDLVDIAKTYEECGEAVVEHEMEKKCDEDFGDGSASDKACRALVDEVADDIINETEQQDAPSICTKFLHQACKYGKI